MTCLTDELKKIDAAMDAARPHLIDAVCAALEVVPLNDVDAETEHRAAHIAEVVDAVANLDSHFLVVLTNVAREMWAVQIDAGPPEEFEAIKPIDRIEGTQAGASADELFVETSNNASALRALIARRVGILDAEALRDIYELADRRLASVLGDAHTEKYGGSLKSIVAGSDDEISRLRWLIGARVGMLDEDSLRAIFELADGILQSYREIEATVAALEAAEALGGVH
jgi:hypothetical protein